MHKLLIVAVLLSGCTAAQLRDGLKLGIDLGDVACKIAAAAAPNEEWLKYTCASVGGIAGAMRNDSLEAPPPRVFHVRVHKDDAAAFEKRYVR